MFKRFQKSNSIKVVQELKPHLTPRQIRIHSINPVENGSTGGAQRRIAFEFLDPPGPWSLQFLESNSDDLNGLQPGQEAVYYETRDEARIRWIETQDGMVIAIASLA